MRKYKGLSFHQLPYKDLDTSVEPEHDHELVHIFGERELTVLLPDEHYCELVHSGVSV
jgi:hypothetical protein